MRRAFADFADTHEAASVRRCWSTWNTLCSYLFGVNAIAANPMELVGKPKPAKLLPKADAEAAAALVAAIDSPSSTRPGTDWPERDRAIVFTALLARLRAHELRGANIGDLRVHDERLGGVLHVHGKNNKARAVPIEPALVAVLYDYLTSRATRFPGQGRKIDTPPRWPAAAPLFVGRDNERITRGVLQYPVLRAFKAAPDAHRAPRGAVHALRHTYATELANSNISVYTLMKLLGHESMATSQRYINAAGADTRAAAARNPLYGFSKRKAQTPNPPEHCIYSPHQPGSGRMSRRSTKPMHNQHL